MRRRRRKARNRLARLGGLLLSVLWIEEAVWGGLSALAPEARDRVAVAVAVTRAEMRRWGVREVGIGGLSPAQRLDVRRRLGLDDLWGLGPTRLDIRLGTSKPTAGGRYDVDARVIARWEKGGQLADSRFEVRVHRGVGTVIRRRPGRFHEPATPYREAGLFPGVR